MKKCSKCKIKKPYSEFSVRASAKDGLQHICKECNKENQRKHYKKNKDKYIERNKEKIIELRQLVRDAKNIPCTDCGYSYPYYVMDFDHQGEKKFNVSSFHKYGKNKILAEIAKCEVVCANCHRERTYGCGSP